MKKNTENLNIIKHIILSAIVVVMLMFTACASSKRKLVTSDTTQKDSLVVKRDSSYSLELHKAINDELFLSVATGDSITDSIINFKLKAFKTSKKSGDNSYSIAYDANRKGFNIKSSVAQTTTVKEKVKEDSQHKKEKAIVVTEKETIVKYRIPFWAYIVFLVTILAVYILAKLRII